MKRFLKYLVFFAIMGTLIFVIKFIMMPLPNIHPVGVLIVSLTVVFRAKALIPIYIYVFLDGIFFGGLWWIPYLYIWAVLWLFAMLLPKNMPKGIAMPVYMVVCGLHGLLFGLLYAPYQALLFGLNFQATLTWIAMGIPFDITHAIANFVMGSLILPLIIAFKYSKKILDS
ncbi:MAG: hypothetical protein IJF58_01280 [Clostridia bacterium]|nr:hypothetical protein [Clostridia bacterium]